MKKTLYFTLAMVMVCGLASAGSAVYTGSDDSVLISWTGILTTGNVTYTPDTLVINFPGAHGVWADWPGSAVDGYLPAGSGATLEDVPATATSWVYQMDIASFGNSMCIAGIAVEIGADNLMIGHADWAGPATIYSDTGSFWMDNTPWSGGTAAASITADCTGLRISRSGDTLTGEYITTGAWTFIASHTPLSGTQSFCFVHDGNGAVLDYVVSEISVKGPGIVFPVTSAPAAVPLSGMPVATTLGLGLLAGAIGLGGAAVIRRKK